MSQRNETKTALLLGMVYSNEKDPLTGQMYRDRVRCEAMERMGYCVKTMDDKHDGDLERVRQSFHTNAMHGGICIKTRNIVYNVPNYSMQKLSSH